MNLAVHNLSGQIREGNTYYEDLVISADQIRRKKEGAIPFASGDVWIPDDVVGIGWDIDLDDVRKRAVSSFVYPG